MPATPLLLRIRQVLVGVSVPVAPTASTPAPITPASATPAALRPSPAPAALCGLHSHARRARSSHGGSRQTRSSHRGALHMHADITSAAAPAPAQAPAQQHPPTEATSMQEVAPTPSFTAAKTSPGLATLAGTVACSSAHANVISICRTATASGRRHRHRHALLIACLAVAPPASLSVTSTPFSHPPPLAALIPHPFS